MKYSSLFTHPSQTPINRAFPSGEELAQLFTTLHHSSPKWYKRGAAYNLRNYL